MKTGFIAKVLRPFVFYCFKRCWYIRPDRPMRETNRGFKKETVFEELQLVTQAVGQV